jgi:hypothetical protein
VAWHRSSHCSDLYVDATGSGADAQQRRKSGVTPRILSSGPPTHPSDISILPLATSPSDQRAGRRTFLKYAGGIAAGMAPLMAARAQQAGASAKVDFPPDHADSEAPEKMPDPGLPPAERIGYAVVGLAG